ncbi:MAG: DUF1080 domain-containing protein [Chitinophagaceae bacterium]|nr:MAG: DUF1080 domain-containing protein [Chitinophagaceae bacterium]
MQKTILALLIIASIVACNNDKEKPSSSEESVKPAAMNNNTLSDQEKTDGWQLLFDGQSTKGWHKYGAAATGDAWKTDNGELHLVVGEKADWQAKSGGDILTDEEFDNFHLKLEWKIDTGGNSGIIFFIHEDSVKYKWPWQTGPEMQVLDNERHSDSKIPKHRAGDLYDLISCSKETVKPALEWNQVEIKSLNGKLELWLNGENVVSTTLWDDNWKKMVAGSKFKDMPDFGTYKKGKIALQDHGNNVWFRNIKVKKL